MRFITKAGIVLAGVAVATSFAACSGQTNNTFDTSSNTDVSDTSNAINPSEIVGNYTGVKSGFVGDEIKEGEEFSLILNKDGTGTNKRDGQEFDLEWKIEGDTFKMTDKFMGITINYTGTYKDGQLEIFNGEPENDFTYEYVYQKN